MKIERALIVGLGVSGRSVARYLARHNINFDIADQKTSLDPALADDEPALKQVRYFGGDWSADLFGQYSHLVVSPGISIRSDAFEHAASMGVEVIGDVELFARAVTKPVLAVTGSNGKSTVVSMAGALLNAAGLRASVVGNVGKPCLDALDDQQVDAYVLELSSFQLETTTSLRAHAACVLNVCEDHLDRYNGLEDYAAVKRSIYNDALNIVYNNQDHRTRPDTGATGVTFSLQNDGAEWYASEGLLCGPSTRVDAQVLKVSGGHNRSNALAAMALASTLVDLPADQAAASDVYATGLASFNGLPHRAELVCTRHEVSWFNDSKGTNVGACISAIEGMDRTVVLIAGGRGKNSDYRPMKDVVSRKCRAVILIGEDAIKISEALGSVVPVYFEHTMRDAVEKARVVAQSGDCVLLSPACASFDMFKNFEVRGAVFADEVRKLCA